MVTILPDVYGNANVKNYLGDKNTTARPVLYIYSFQVVHNKDSVFVCIGDRRPRPVESPGYLIGQEFPPFNFLPRFQLDNYLLCTSNI